jgi:hypothetical protein
MAKQYWEDDTHYRTVSEDGKTSWRFESHAAELFGTDICVEVTEHHGDGTSTAYEPPGLLDSILGSHGPQK